MHHRIKKWADGALKMDCLIKFFFDWTLWYIELPGYFTYVGKIFHYWHRLQLLFFRTIRTTILERNTYIKVWCSLWPLSHLVFKWSQKHLLIHMSIIYCNNVFKDSLVPGKPALHCDLSNLGLCMPYREM